MKFADLYQMGGTGVKGGWQLYRWVKQSIADGKPYDQMVREMIVSGGSFVYEPRINFYYGLFLGPEGMVTQVPRSSLRELDAGRFLRYGGFLHAPGTQSRAIRSV